MTPTPTTTTTRSAARAAAFETGTLSLARPRSLPRHQPVTPRLACSPSTESTLARWLSHPFFLSLYLYAGPRPGRRFTLASSRSVPPFVRRDKYTDQDNNKEDEGEKNRCALAPISRLSAPAPFPSLACPSTPHSSPCLLSFSGSLPPSFLPWPSLPPSLPLPQDGPFTLDHESRSPFACWLYRFLPAC